MIDGSWITRYVGDPVAERTLTARPCQRIALIRHAEPIPREQRAAGEALDPPLTARGRGQSEALRAWMASEPAKVWYASSMRRAQETASVGSGGLPVCAINDLREVELIRNDYAGQAAEDIEAWSRGASAFRETGAWASYPTAETGAELRSRAQGALASIRTQSHGQEIAIVTHGAFINALVATILGAAADMFFQPGHCSISRLRIDGDNTAIESLNEMQHLPVRLQTV